MDRPTSPRSCPTRLMMGPTSTMKRAPSPAQRVVPSTPLSREREPAVTKVYVQDIKEKDRVESVFKLTRKSVAVGKSGKPFLTLVLGDKTGEIDGRIWEDVDAMEAVAAVGELVKVTA